MCLRTKYSVLHIVDRVNDMVYNMPMSTSKELPITAHLHHTGMEPHLLREVMRTYQAALNVFSREAGAPGARLALMRLLATCDEEELGVLQLARRLGIDAAAVARQVKDMEAERLLARRADARDKRRSYVRLTQKGLRLFREVHDRVHELEQKVLAGVASEDVTTATRVLAHMRAALEELR